MSIEVLVKGQIVVQTYTVWCHRCRSQLRFKPEDADHHHNHIDGPYMVIACPVCGARLEITTPRTAV